MGIGVITIGKMVVHFARIAAIEQTPATGTARWNIEHLKAEADAPYVAKGSLSPIYPATPGKELLGKPVYTASKTRINNLEPLQLHNFTRQINLAGGEDRNHPRQGLGYMQERPSLPLLQRMPAFFGRGIY